MSGARPSGPARSGGWRIGGGQPAERMERTPWDEIDDLKREIEELKHELRVALFNEETQRRRADGLAENFKRWRREDGVKLDRVRALVNVRRKTLRMDDLRRALGQSD